MSRTPAPAVESQWFIHKTSCPECGVRRSSKQHDANACSQARQARFAEENRK